ncbi:TRM11 family SAM-dependent methyltransferase [Halalkalibacter nanhaiisediminis]|uniref:tRNA G10 N-methylase Trm11 n=1 Tax=Halalkalibacter nanhaiisediminis TaxID=688079 RepID=A0A562QQL7_9BACI|nr:RsmD family RNA methyltransferase [Halalkalibacter nanhaiisediminis]TWI59039.1 tRNA G10 N-methylase Trm11 [Halalkalibacter nanhaiisediminis]
MDEFNVKPINYLYTYSCHEDELSLCRLEMRSLFGFDTESSILESSLRIDPSRSPFIKERIDVLYKENTVEDIARQVKKLHIVGSTFRVIFMKNDELDVSEKVGFEERRSIERKIGLLIKGKVDLVNPELLFAIMKGKNGWILGQYFKSEAIWLRHQSKPQQYSTALSTRVARAVVNIAIPNPLGIKAIDPCCGIGTVLIEALSMGIDIVGSDLNPLVLLGARENIAHFGFQTEVALRDIRNVTGKYDVAIVDMPYNLCSVITVQEKLEMIQSARRFSKKLVVVTIEPMDSAIQEAGFEIVDRCVAKKGTFSREVLVCE